MKTELKEHGQNKIGIFLCGDMNVHHMGWLIHSTSTTREGRELFDVCNEHNLSEYSKHPTRENNLLDLTLSNLDGNVRTTIIPGISDHMAVLCKLSLPIYCDHAVERYCYFYKQADWKGLIRFYSTVNWSFLYSIDDVNKYVETFTQFVITNAQQFIPYEKNA